LQALRRPFMRKRLEVLKDVSLTVPTGSITGLLGPNGAGKTTLLRILATSVLPDGGTAKILGRDVTRHTAQVRARLGFVLSEERSFFWRLTARQNLKFFAVLADMESKAIPDRIKELSELLRLDQELDKPFRDLSTGMRQRLSIARALLHDPEVLLIDEPTRGLDPGAAQRTRNFIKEKLSAEMKKSVLLATHNMQEARQLCDRIAFLKEGKIVTEDEVAEALKKANEVFEVDE
jgi:ABC-2 type transport system ATP-binding protein